MQPLRSLEFLIYEFIKLRPHPRQLGVLGEGLLQDILHRLHIVVGGPLHCLHLRQQSLHVVNLEGEPWPSMHWLYNRRRPRCLPSAGCMSAVFENDCSSAGRQCLTLCASATPKLLMSSSSTAFAPLLKAGTSTTCRQRTVLPIPRCRHFVSSYACLLLWQAMMY